MVHTVSPAGTVGSIVAFPGCNGVVATDDLLYVVGWDGGQVVRIDLATVKASTITTIREALLDGIVLLDDGSLLVSSAGGSAIYRVQPNGSKVVLFDNLSAPADIGYDVGRALLLIPLLDANQVLAKPMP
jgi:sugar lactone lactonase YvrE